MRVYLASWYSSREEMAKRGTELRALGIEVTSRWLEEGINTKASIKDVAEDYLRDTAAVDIEDILIADTVVMNVPSELVLEAEDIPLASWARGGRHFEAGFQYALMVFYHYLPAILKGNVRRLILVGHRENVFHYIDGVKPLTALGFKLPEIPTFETWEETKAFMVKHSEKVADAV